MTAPTGEAPATAETAPRTTASSAPDVRRVVIGQALIVLGCLLVGVVASLILVSPLRAARDQHVAYADLRYALANATAPIGQVRDGALIPPGTPVALLTIPALGLEQVVLEGTDSTITMSGPGHRRDSVLPGQVGHSVILGRAAAYGGPFRSIGDLTPGAEIVVTTGQGESRFAVTGVRLSGEQGTALAPGESRLTLITAGGSAYLPSGLVQVDARLTTEPLPGAAMPLTSSMLASSELPMAGTPSAWLGLLLWGELLLVAAVASVWLTLRWGRWQAWVVVVPVLLALGLAVTTQAIALLPNLL